jgi:glyoxylase-like metal-dependent hydrolase (beta-lactamase superfamily II)
MPVDHAGKVCGYAPDVRQLADDLWLLRGFPPHAINVYVIGDVLIDAATRRAGRRILRQLEGRDIQAHALTHAHPDHQGASKEVCEALGIPLWCHTDDADAMEQGTIPDMQPDHPINRVIERFWLGPPHPVARRLEEGDEIAGFTVLHVPGHSAGHVAFWRESDRALILGDVVTNIDTITGLPGLHEPRSFFTPDPKRNRDSARRLAALEPELVCFGHGKPLRDPVKLRKFADGLALD